MRPKVYLAGAISGLTYDEGQDWRKEAQFILDQFGIDGYSPLRSKEYLRKYGALPSTVSASNALSTHKGIVARDLHDVRSADALLINLLGAKMVSIGTVAEIGAAYALNKPMILVMEKEGNVHQHGFILEMAGFHVDTLEDGIEIVRTVLLP